MSVDILLSVVVVLMNNVSEQNDEITFKGIVKCTKILIVDYEVINLFFINNLKCLLLTFIETEVVEINREIRLRNTH